MSFELLRGNALALPPEIEAESVDAVISSPPYFSLRSYQDGGEHYEGQLGSEPTPQEFIENLLVATAEMVRVLKPGGSIFINLGDKFAGSGGHNNDGISSKSTPQGNGHVGGVGKDGPNKVKATRRSAPDRYNQESGGIKAKSLMGLPWRYAIGCIDNLGLILRRDLIWHKLNGMPESVTDRCRSSHEYWFHFTKKPRYFSAIDEIRDAQTDQRTGQRSSYTPGSASGQIAGDGTHESKCDAGLPLHPLGKLPGSVWSIPSSPLKVPEELDVDHFACVDAETEILTARGWSTHDQLVEGEAVAGYNLDTQLAEWTRCHAVHRYEHDGPLVSVEKRDLSMRLTPNHRCIVQRRNGSVGVVRADELIPNTSVPRSTEWGSYEWKSIGEPMAALLGWVAAEGWVSAEGSVKLSQSLTANPEHVATIDELLGSIETPPVVTRRVKHRRAMDSLWRKQSTRVYRGRNWEDVSWRLPLGLAQEVTRLLDDKRLRWGMLGLPENERRALLDAFIDGDGHRRPDGRIGIYQKYRQNLDVLQAIAVTLGYRTSLTEESERFVLYLTTGQRWLTLRGTNGGAKPIPTEHYTGTVWCPTTGTGTFVARRRGRVFVTGNSFPPEWPRRLILGWTPSGVCVACGEGRRPVVVKEAMQVQPSERRAEAQASGNASRTSTSGTMTAPPTATITGYECACTDTTAPTRPAVILDPFCGTGTTPMVAHALGRHGIGVDLSADYLRLAQWRCESDPKGHQIRDEFLREDPRAPEIIAEHNPDAVVQSNLGLL